MDAYLAPSITAVRYDFPHPSYKYAPTAPDLLPVVRDDLEHGLVPKLLGLFVVGHVLAGEEVVRRVHPADHLFIDCCVCVCLSAKANGSRRMEPTALAFQLQGLLPRCP